MTKTITKIGNSQEIIFDAAFMDLARLKVGDRVDATIIPDSGAIF
jgi:antitoxin component of MazEF toxin-antitoxin module